MLGPKLPTVPQINEAVKYFKPSEIIGIFNNALTRQNESAQVIYLRGVYLQKEQRVNWAFFYDILRDEDSEDELSIQLTASQRENLKNGNLVMIGGVLSRKVTNKGGIQLLLKVSRIEVVQEQAVDENEMARMELRRKKSVKGFKNVDGTLEQLLYTDVRPRVALVFAQSSITMSDFNAGLNAAASAIDFKEFRANFSNSTELVATLKEADVEEFDVIAVVRGGGSGIEKLDDLTVLETVAELKTPIIAAVGHVEEKLFLKQLVDKEASTPNGLGQYFSEMVEKVTETKTRSRSVLTEQIRKQFQQQLEAGQKQNKELQERLTALTENQRKANEMQKDSVDKHNTQILVAQKQNEELRKQLDSIQKVHNEQIKGLTEAQKEQIEQQKKLNDNLTQARNSYETLQQKYNMALAQGDESRKLLEETTKHASELEARLSEFGTIKTWKRIAIGAVVLCLILFSWLLLI